MNGRIICALMVALCLPQQPGKPGAAPSHAVTIFEKTLSSNKKMIVTCEEIPLVLTPKELAEREQIKKEVPTSILSDHLYAYSYVTVTRGGQRSVVWTQHQQTFGAIMSSKSAPMSMGLEVYDVALQDNIFLVLYQQGERTEVNIVRLNAGQRVAPSPPRSRQPQPATGREAVEAPLGPGRVVERAGPLDAVASGHIIGPTSDGNVVVQLSHVVKHKEGSPRITLYHLTHDAQGQEFWAPDPSNIYANGEHPGIVEFNELKRQH